MKKLILTCIFVAAFISASAEEPDRLPELARRATSEDEQSRVSAIAALRQAGPGGLDALFEAYAQEIKKHQPSEQWSRITAALDSVAKQTDAYTAHLYWYTNLDEAKAAARSSGKPILSLRLLGNLDEEYSCANSRFFRSALYANGGVSQILREHFVLHWKSVRPVPKITIDFGDGRKLVRTITGNSIHYVLNADGMVIDALPGLYGPKAFLSALGLAERAELEARTKPSSLAFYHALRQLELLAAWKQDYQQVQGMTPVTPAISVSAPKTDVPSARLAATKAFGKSLIEATVVNALVPPETTPDTVTDDAVWKKIALLHAEDAQLDSSSRALIVAKNPDALTAGRVARTKADVENPMLRLIRNFETSIAEDTVRNEYQMHPRLHAWLASGNAARDVEALNARVYAELFLTPNSDPWLGLATGDAYCALPNAGVLDERSMKK